jgi:hypothetical protein
MYKTGEILVAQVEALNFYEVKILPQEKSQYASEIFCVSTDLYEMLIN